MAEVTQAEGTAPRGLKTGGSDAAPGALTRRLHCGLWGDVTAGKDTPSLQGVPAHSGRDSGVAPGTTVLTRHLFRKCLCLFTREQQMSSHVFSAACE